jgi:hypothetical protein
MIHTGALRPIAAGRSVGPNISGKYKEVIHV